MFGPSGNRWFNEKPFEWHYERPGMEAQKGQRTGVKLPLFAKWPFPKRGRVVSDPTAIAETIVPELHKWFPKGRYETSKKGKNYEYIWRTDKGFSFELMTYEQAATEFESATLGFTWFDEPPPAAIFKATVARMRAGGIIFITATPLSGSAWMYDHIVTYKGDAKRDFIQSDVSANCIEHGIRGRLKHSDIERMIGEYDEDDLQARVKGRFHHLTGIVFKNFNRKIHVIKPFKITKQDFVVIEALDPHPRNPDALLWLAIDRKGTKFIIDEVYDKMKTPDLAAYALKREDKYRIERRLADPSAFSVNQHEQDDRPLASRLYDEYGLDYMKGTKDRVGADRRIKDALDYEMSGNDIIRAPEIFIFNTCERTIWEFEHYQWDDWRGKAAERKAPKEKPMDKDDHMIENLGRILLQEFEFVPMEKISRSSSVGIITEKELDPFE